MGIEKFNPSDEQYKKVEDLPKEHQNEFVNIPEEEGGGFVREEAYDRFSEADTRGTLEKVAAKIKEILGENPHAIEEKLAKLHEDAIKIGQHREMVLKELKRGGGIIIDSLGDVPKDLRADKEVVLEAVKKHGWNLQFASEDLRSDKEFMFEAINISQYAIGYASEDLRSDKEFMFEAINISQYAFEYASEDLRSDKEFVLEVIKKCGDVYQLPRFVSEDLRADKEVVLQWLKKCAAVFFYNTPEDSLGDVSEDLRADKEVVLEAVKKASRNIKYASEDLRSDKEFILEVIKARTAFLAKSEATFYSPILQFVSEDLRYDLNFLIKVAKVNPMELAFAPRSIKAKLGIEI